MVVGLGRAWRSAWAVSEPVLPVASEGSAWAEASIVCYSVQQFPSLREAVSHVPRTSFPAALLSPCVVLGDPSLICLFF